jgi:hypothetical protein
MMRLIDADALKKLILEERDKIPFTVPAAPYEFVKEKANIHGNAVRSGIRKALRCMEQTPTIEAEPVRHGKITHRTIWHTSGWGEIYTSYSCCSFQEKGKMHHNFCPNCGAKMDLEG